MDAVALLALMSKANQVFGGPGIFLSFPAVTPIPLKPEDLDFANPFSSPAVMGALADLSLNLNTLPSGTLFLGAGDPFLWKACRDWLPEMVLAKDQMTADEQTQYDQAKALLTAKDADGLLIDSPQVVVYKQCRDAWFSATQDYKNQKITANTSSDPAVLKQWQDVDEPQLHGLVDQALSDWENKGNKTKVENAQQTEAQLEAHSPSAAWTEWSEALNLDLQSPTDPASNMDCALTTFSPPDVFGPDWPTFHLASDEILQLTQSAPDELRQIFSESGETSTITSLSFEFRSAAVVRSWLDTSMFSVRFWKFHDNTPPLSDGAATPQGSWPAYIYAVVLARNIQVTTQTAPEPQHMPSFPPISQAWLSKVAAARLAKRQATAGTDATKAHLHALAGMPVVSAGTMAKPLPPMSGPKVVPGVAPDSPGMRLIRETHRSGPPVTQQAGASDTATTDAPPSQSVTSVVDKDVSILAFVCRQLAQTPNPDPTLNW